MAKVYEAGIDDDLAAWIAEQPLFFVGTAPASGGHVNVSPKGYDTLRVVDRQRVAYRDLTGSGAETAAHLRDDGRITLMWTAFQGPPRITRVQGRGQVLFAGDDGYEELDALLPAPPGARAIVVVEADRVSTSCGFSIPKMELLEDRDTLVRWAEKKGPDGLERYWTERNAASIDGLPAMPR